uniref:Uncharacterized protein n=1 Tax=Ananas comosus var. bracteatus TaxID=296719 RepID=A0A6V7QH11_ANACO|nr:unnamed protein product [Ananas comosus var. bracteatus]
MVRNELRSCLGVFGANRLSGSGPYEAVYRYWSCVPVLRSYKPTYWEARAQIEVPTNRHQVIEEKLRFGFVCRGARGVFDHKSREVIFSHSSIIIRWVALSKVFE